MVAGGGIGREGGGGAGGSRNSQISGEKDIKLACCLYSIQRLDLLSSFFLPAFAIFLSPSSFPLSFHVGFVSIFIF